MISVAGNALPEWCGAFGFSMLSSFAPFADLACGTAVPYCMGSVCAGEAGCHAGASPAGRIGLFTTESCVREEAVRPNPKARRSLNRPVATIVNLIQCSPRNREPRASRYLNGEGCHAPLSNSDGRILALIKAWLRAPIVERDPDTGDGAEAMRVNDPRKAGCGKTACPV